MIVIVFGLPGSGKSYFANRLAPMINAVHLSSDGIRNDLFPRKSYSAAEKLAVYDALFEQMQKLTGEHKHLVVDATFYKSAFRERFSKSQQPIFIEIIANETISRERLQHKRPGTDADLSIYKEIKEEWEPMKEQHLVLESTGSNISAMLERAKAYIGAKERKEADE